MSINGLYPHIYYKIKSKKINKFLQNHIIFVDFLLELRYYIPSDLTTPVSYTHLDGTMKCADATMRNVTVESGTFKGNLTTNYDAYIGHNLHLSHEVGMFSQITLGENGDTAITMSDDQIRIGILNNNQDLLSRPFISITKDDIFLNLNEDNHIRISSILGVTMKTKGKVIDMNYDI